jgi:hypothetical protein
MQSHEFRKIDRKLVTLWAVAEVVIETFRRAFTHPNFFGLSGR